MGAVSSRVHGKLRIVGDEPAEAAALRNGGDFASQSISPRPGSCPEDDKSVRRQRSNGSHRVANAIVVGEEHERRQKGGAIELRGRSR